ncbi:MAG: hypothetical protein ACOX3T_01660 [Bdellovibrionota bacterium]
MKENLGSEQEALRLIEALGMEKGLDLQKTFPYLCNLFITLYNKGKVLLDENGLDKCLHIYKSMPQLIKSTLKSKICQSVPLIANSISPSDVMKKVSNGEIEATRAAVKEYILGIIIAYS